MTPYPVHYHVTPPPRFTRAQLAARLVAFAVLGIVGVTFGTVFCVAYLALPVFAASRISGPRGAEGYLETDGPRIVRALRWYAAICAWAGLTAELLPGRSPPETITLEIDEMPRPTASAPLRRVITGIPSALVLGILGCIGSLVWIWAALCVLVSQQIGPVAFQYLEGLQRWSARLLAYQASLVDEYPPFSFTDSAPLLPAARVMP